jgi:hypothetical protein
MKRVEAILSQLRAEAVAGVASSTTSVFPDEHKKDRKTRAMEEDDAVYCLLTSVFIFDDGIDLWNRCSMNHFVVMLIY